MPLTVMAVWLVFITLQDCELAFTLMLGSRTLTFRFLHCTQPARDFRWERRPGGYVAMSTVIHRIMDPRGIVYQIHH